MLQADMFASEPDAIPHASDVSASGKQKEISNPFVDIKMTDWFYDAVLYICFP